MGKSKILVESTLFLIYIYRVSYFFSAFSFLKLTCTFPSCMFFACHKISFLAPSFHSVHFLLVIMVCLRLEERVLKKVLFVSSELGQVFREILNADGVLVGILVEDCREAIRCITS